VLRLPGVHGAHRLIRAGIPTGQERILKMAKAADKLSPSLEDYLEAVLILIRRGRVARVKDIAAHLGVGKSSVTGALKALSKRELVNYKPYEFITLTDRGRELAEEVSGRHVLLRQFLTGVLGLDDELAEANACRMEHAVDAELLEQLGRFSKFVQDCPRVGRSWVRAFADGCGGGRMDPEKCGECIEAGIGENRESPAVDSADASAGSTGAAAGEAVMPLAMSSIGQEVTLAEVRGGRDLQHRLAEMGLTPGARFTVVKKGNPGPFIISVKGSRLVLGRGTIHRVTVKAAS